jgi:hypothetical protein
MGKSRDTRRTRRLDATATVLEPLEGMARQRVVGFVGWFRKFLFSPLEAPPAFRKSGILKFRSVPFQNFIHKRLVLQFNTSSGLYILKPRLKSAMSQRNYRIGGKTVAIHSQHLAIRDLKLFVQSSC